MIGAWQLRSLSGPVELYTRVPADFFISEDTGEEYVLGERKLFECSANNDPLPELVEQTGKFKLLFKDSQNAWTAEDSLREIMVQGFMK